MTFYVGSKSGKKKKMQISLQKLQNIKIIWKNDEWVKNDFHDPWK